MTARAAKFIAPAATASAPKPRLRIVSRETSFACERCLAPQPGQCLCRPPRSHKARAAHARYMRAYRLRRKLARNDAELIITDQSALSMFIRGILSEAA